MVTLELLIYMTDNVEKNDYCFSKHKSVRAEVHVQSLIFSILSFESTLFQPQYEVM